MIYILIPLALWALVDIYICYRWVRKPEVDFTNGIFTYWATKWLCMSKSKLLAEKLGYPGKDLSEILLGTDDGETS